MKRFCQNREEIFEHYPESFRALQVSMYGYECHVIDYGSETNR
ncbi:MAG: hypothetical protein WCB46_07265 [Methanoregula sp.]